MNNITFNKHKKAYEISKYWIDKTSLNLSGLNVLTEVGSSNYAYLPLIASLAGAKNVIAWCSDSKYGLAPEVIQEAKNAIKVWECKDNIIFRPNNRNAEDIHIADIITNSGMIRPLDCHFLSFVKSNAVITLMFEAWELRSGDVDLDVCRKNNIRVTGVSENNPTMNIFEYSGILAIKLILNSGIEIFESKILIWSNDDFGKVAKRALLKLAPKSIVICNKLDEFYQHVKNVDLVYFCDYNEDRTYFGPTGFLDLELITQLNPTVKFCHLYGKISKSECDKYGISIFPDKDGCYKLMTETLSYVGAEPVIKLFIASLKAGQEALEEGLIAFSQKII